MPGLGQAVLERVLDEDPGAVVLRLFLRPDQLVQLGHRLSRLTNGSPGNGIELLDADDLGVVVSPAASRASISS